MYVQYKMLLYIMFCQIVHTIWACGQKFQIPKCSAASEMHFKSIPMLGGLTQHLWVRPLWFWALHMSWTGTALFLNSAENNLLK